MSEHVHELRLVVTTADYTQAVSFYRDALGLREVETYTARGGRVLPPRNAGRVAADAVTDL